MWRLNKLLLFITAMLVSLSVFFFSTSSVKADCPEACVREDSGCGGQSWTRCSTNNPFDPDETAIFCCFGGCNGDCGFDGGCCGGGGGCTSSGPGAPTNLDVNPKFAAGGYNQVASATATLSWTSGGWGNNCYGNVKSYSVYYTRVALSSSCPAIDPVNDAGYTLLGTNNDPDPNSDSNDPGTAMNIGSSLTQDTCWYVKASNYGSARGGPARFHAPRTANCFNLTGTTQVYVGTPYVYTAGYSNSNGPLTRGGMELYNNASVCSSLWSPVTVEPIPPGNYSFTWTPTSQGNYTLYCRAWNDGVAECRGACYSNTTNPYRCDGSRGGGGDTYITICTLPQPPTNLQPVNGASLTCETSVTLSWSPSPGATNYVVQMTDTTTGATVLDINTTGLSQSVSSLTPSHNYTWRVRPVNACGIGWASERSSSFTINGCTVSIQGNIHEKYATEACSSAPTTRGVADQSDDYVQKTDQPTFQGSISSPSGSYTITNVPYTISQTGVVCPVNIEPSSPGFSRYRLVCINSQNAASATGWTQTGNCAQSGSVFTQAANGTSLSLDLGYESVSSGWFQTLLGDIFSNCDYDTSCSYGLINGVPSSAGTYDALPYTADNNDTGLTPLSGSTRGGIYGILISRAPVVAKTSDGDNRTGYGMATTTAPTTQPPYFIEKYQDWSQFTWPATVDFIPPEGATTITSSTTPNCTSFGTSAVGGDAYRMDIACAQSFVNSLSGTTYNWPTDGTVVLYITGASSTPLNIQNMVRTIGSNHRLILIVNGTVSISSSINTWNGAPPPSAFPTFNSDPMIDAAIIAQGSSSGGIGFTCIGGIGGCNGTDGSILVNGSLLARDGGIIFRRDRGQINNQYPAEIVRYKLREIIDLTTTEITSSVPNKTGLFEYSVSFEVR